MGHDDTCSPIKRCCKLPHDLPTSLSFMRRVREEGGCSVADWTVGRRRRAQTCRWLRGEADVERGGESALPQYH